MAQNITTGVALHQGTLIWTTLRRGKSGWEMAEHQSEPLSSEATGPDTPAFAEAIKRWAGHHRGDIAFGLPADRALLRIVDLPTTDVSEMQSMVDLQVDKFSPFPVEQMTVSFEILAQYASSSRVLIAAVQRDLINSVGAAFRDTGVWPKRLDVDVMGWWEILKENNEVPTEGLYVALRVAGDGTALIITDRGVPVVVRALGSPAGLSEEEYCSELADEVGYSLASVEAEFGIAGGVQVTVWREGSTAPPRLAGLEDANSGVQSDLLVARLAETCGGAEVHSRSLAELPPCSEGFARRAIRTDTVLLNLAPAEWRSEEQHLAIRRTMIIATAAFFAIWLAGLGIFAARFALMRRETASLKTMLAAIEGPAQEVKELSAKIRSFEQYADRSRSALEALREISLLLPQGVEMTSFSYRKGETVNIRGIADMPEPIYDFFQALERSAFFEKVEPGDIRSKVVGVAQKSEFSVTAYMPGSRKGGGS